jgi:hypothetical protein
MYVVRQPEGHFRYRKKRLLQEKKCLREPLY